MLKLGRAQGVAIATAMQAEWAYPNIPPRKSSNPLLAMVTPIRSRFGRCCSGSCKFIEQPEYLDATDALAVAVCHHFQETSPLAAVGKSKGWDKFLQQHPERLCKAVASNEQKRRLMFVN